MAVESEEKSKICNNWVIECSILDSPFVDSRNSEHISGWAL